MFSWKLLFDGAIELLFVYSACRSTVANNCNRRTDHYFLVSRIQLLGSIDDKSCFQNSQGNLASIKSFNSSEKVKKQTIKKQHFYSQLTLSVNIDISPSQNFVFGLPGKERLPFCVVISRHWSTVFKRYFQESE